MSCGWDVFENPFISVLKHRYKYRSQNLGQGRVWNGNVKILYYDFFFPRTFQAQEMIVNYWVCKQTQFWSIFILANRGEFRRYEKPVYKMIKGEIAAWDSSAKKNYKTTRKSYNTASKDYTKTSKNYKATMKNYTKTSKNYTKISKMKIQ